MAAPRRGGKGRASTPKLAVWAVLMLLLGLGLGLLASHNSCSRKTHRPKEQRGRASEPVPKPKPPSPAPPVPEPEVPKAKLPEAVEPAPMEPTPQPLPKPAKPERVIKPEPPAPVKPPKPAKVEPPAPPRKVAAQEPAKPAEKPPVKPARPEKVQVVEPRIPQSPLPKFVLIIDDLGYAQPELVKRLCMESVPFSVAVLPYQEFTQDSANIAFSRGKEVMLHLPMEPIGYPGPGKDPGPSAVLFDLKEAEIRARVRAALEAIPHRSGVNNHMGSRITPDRTRMTWILQEIKARHYFFVDSRTEKDSVAYDVARELKVPSLQRRVFLDDDKSFAEMSKQWERAIEMAHREGEVVIIGHIYPETVEALEKLIPSARGKVQFVKAGSLVK